MRQLLMAGAALAMLSGTAAWAQPWGPPPGGDPDGYYSRSDHDGYYGRDGRYHRLRDYRNDDDDDAGPPPPPPSGYYQVGRYEENCRRDRNAPAGTIFGAI